jgi:DNA (cytosine-5)-methyltransferase 1
MEVFSMTERKSNQRNEEKKRAIDLFCGIGGNSWGARDAGLQIVAGFDMWELAGKVFQHNFPEATYYPGKLQDNTMYNLKSRLGEIDLIVASPECTSHSVARGNKAKNKESLELAYQVLRFSDKLKPRWLVIENVISMKSWEGYQDFLTKLKKDYYYLEQTLVASDFGVPQSRRRLFILCDREEQPAQIPIPDRKIKAASTIINNNGAYKFSPLVTEKRAQNTLKRAQRAIDTLGTDQAFLMVYYGTDAAGGWQSLDVPLRTITTLDRFALVRPNGNGDHEMRMLQPDELQKAMGFPAKFKLQQGTRREKIHLLGNAVCPQVIEAILKSLTDSQKGSHHHGTGKT